MKLSKFETLVDSIPSGSKYRRVVSEAHSYGHDEGFDEARAEFLVKWRKQIERGDTKASQLAFIEERIEKARDARRWPDGWE